MNNKMIIISGATATGKTAASIYLSQELKEAGYEVSIVNFDSLIFYNELNIGTAKPSKEELNLADHYLIDITSAKTPLNASKYIKLANPLINELHSKNHIVILVGGSGFYLRALIKGMYQGTPTDDSIKQKSSKLFNESGIAPFLEILKNNDPESHQSLHQNDHYRILRAVEYFWSTGAKFSDQKLSITDPYDFTKPVNPDWNLLHFYLDVPKKNHFDIICRRTSQMIQNGLVEEVQNLLDAGFTGNEKPLQSIGYKETLAFIKGEFDNQEQFQERISISTRQLAKAQRTWFNKITGKNSLNPLDQKYKKSILDLTLSQLHL